MELQKRRKINFIYYKVEMTDNSRAKTHLKTAETKLNDLSNVSEINKITAARSLDLFNNLHTGNNLFVDAEVRTDIENVRNRLQA